MVVAFWGYKVDCAGTFVDFVGNVRYVNRI